VFSVAVAIRVAPWPSPHDSETGRGDRERRRSWTVGRQWLTELERAKVGRGADESIVDVGQNCSGVDGGASDL